MKLYVVRHGQTDYNKENRYQGDIDVPLNGTGWSQVKEAVALFHKKKIDVLVTSPLSRCLAMAQAIANDKSLKPVIYPEFRERGLGIFEGLHRNGEVQAKYPKLWKEKITRQYEVGPPGGESIKQVEERVFRGLEKLRDHYDGKVVLLVTHEFVAQVIKKYFNPELSGESFFKDYLENGQVISFEFD